MTAPNIHSGAHFQSNPSESHHLPCQEPLPFQCSNPTWHDLAPEVPTLVSAWLERRPRNARTSCSWPTGGFKGRYPSTPATWRTLTGTSNTTPDPVEQPPFRRSSKVSSRDDRGDHWLGEEAEGQSVQYGLGLFLITPYREIGRSRSTAPARWYGTGVALSMASCERGRELLHVPSKWKKY